jgi:HDOD domain
LEASSCSFRTRRNDLAPPEDDRRSNARAVRLGTSTPAPIESVDQAVLILGHDGMRQLVAAVAFKPLINVQSGHFTRRGAPRVWEQTERAGGVCRLLAPSAGASAFEAYLVTLLINVGTIVALRVLDERQPDRDAVGSRPFCTRFVIIVRDLAMQIGRAKGSDRGIRMFSQFDVARGYVAEGYGPDAVIMCAGS